jgi:hypothetical protein
MAFLPQPQAVVEHHPRAPERPRQGLPLPWRWAEAVTVPDLHGIRTYRRPMTINDDQRRGRCIVSCMHVSLVFATNYRRGALDSAMP